MLNTKVVILNWNGEEWLRRFLPRVVATLPEWAHLVVADNGSEDSSEEVVSRFEGVEWLPLGENYGFAEGTDVPQAKARGNYGDSPVLQASGGRPRKIIVLAVGVAHYDLRFANSCYFHFRISIP